MNGLDSNPSATADWLRFWTWSSVSQLLTCANDGGYYTRSQDYCKALPMFLFINSQDINHSAQLLTWINSCIFWGGLVLSGFPITCASSTTVKYPEALSGSPLDLPHTCALHQVWLHIPFIFLLILGTRQQSPGPSTVTFKTSMQDINPALLPVFNHVLITYSVLMSPYHLLDGAEQHFSLAF